MSRLDDAETAIQRARAYLRRIPATALDDAEKRERRRIADHLRDAEHFAAGDVSHARQYESNAPQAAYSEVRQALSHISRLEAGVPAEARTALEELVAELHAAEDALEAHWRMT